MHKCEVYQNTTCPHSLLSGQELSSLYDTDKLFDYKTCFGLITSAAGVISFRIDLYRVYSSLNISFVIGQLQDCDGPYLFDWTNILKFALGLELNSELECYTYNFPFVFQEGGNSGIPHGTKASVFASSCTNIPARYIKVTCSNTYGYFALAKLFVSGVFHSCPEGQYALSYSSCAAVLKTFLSC
jgi:hypothetical protein